MCVSEANAYKTMNNGDNDDDDDSCFSLYSPFSFKFVYGLITQRHALASRR